LYYHNVTFSPDGRESYVHKLMTVILSLSKDDGFARPAPFDGSTELAEVRLRVLDNAKLSHRTETPLGLPYLPSSDE
jgi:hypothetical protein